MVFWVKINSNSHSASKDVFDPQIPLKSQYIDQTVRTQTFGTFNSIMVQQKLSVRCSFVPTAHKPVSTSSAKILTGLRRAYCLNYILCLKFNSWVSCSESSLNSTDGRMQDRHRLNADSPTISKATHGLPGLEKICIKNFVKYIL